MKNILIIGAGAMGSAFSVPCVENNNNVSLLGTHLEDNLNLVGVLDFGGSYLLGIIFSLIVTWIIPRIWKTLNLAS